MVERLIALDFDHPVRLFWGARTPEDLYLPTLPAQWKMALKDFDFTTALSDIRHPDHAEGLVHEAALAALNEPELPLFYLGGSPPWPGRCSMRWWKKACPPTISTATCSITRRGLVSRKLQAATRGWARANRQGLGLAQQACSVMPHRVPATNRGQNAPGLATTTPAL